jgi:two-component system, chemotaxis family, protein-glutamate methylesterase/glutaminase
MPTRDIIVVGASAGGVETLVDLVQGLPADLPASVFVVLHVRASRPTALADVLQRRSGLGATDAADGEPIRPGRIYVAPADNHLLVKRGFVRVVHGPKENGRRPAVDPLFRTAARAYGQRVIGVVLSGSLDDGTAGLRAVKRAGGVAIVQDPDDAIFPDMPRSAIENVAVDEVVPLAKMPALLARLARDEVAAKEGADVLDGLEPDITELSAYAPNGPPSVFSCPECGGALWENDGGGVLTYRCHAGHGYSEQALLGSHDAAVEAALATALRVLQERSMLARRMAARASERGRSTSVELFESQAAEAEARASVLRHVLEDPGRLVPAATTESPEQVVTGSGD